MKRLLACLFVVLSLGLMFNVNAEDKPKSWIGIEFTSVTEEFINHNKLNANTPKNIIVIGVVKTSAADEAKIIPGDVIISVNNNVFKRTQDLIDFLKTTQAGDIITAKIYRNGSTQTKKIKLKKFPDPGFKPEWVEGSKKLKSPRPNYWLENTQWFTKKTDKILYPKYFSKEILKKYDHDNPVVVCVQKNSSNNILQLYDQIIAVQGIPVDSMYINNPPLTNEPVQITIKRNNRIIKKIITPTIPKVNKFLSDKGEIRHDCTPEYVDYDCAVDFWTAWNLPKNSKGKGWRKTLACLKDYPIVPFVASYGKEINFKMHTITWYLGYLQYEAPQKDLEEINKILAIAKKELKEFENFQKLYPGHGMQEDFNAFIQAITRVTSWATGSYSDDLKSTKDTTIKTDKETVESTKLALEKIIKNKKINSPEAIKFLTSKLTYFKRANEYDYIIKKYLEAKKVINWKTDNLDKYFDNIYTGLSSSYLKQQKYELALDILNEGLDKAENNYENLYFKNAYSEFLFDKIAILLMSKTSYLINEGKDFKKITKKHLSNLEKLSSADKEKMIEIDKDYYLDLLYILYLLKLLGVQDEDTKNKATYYPLKSLDFIKSNKKYSFDFEYLGALSSLLQASIIDDDKKNFNFANNELAIEFSKSVGNPKKLTAIRASSTMLLSSYEMNGYYLESDKFIKFIQDTFTIDEQIKNDQVIRDSFVMYSYYAGQSALRNNDIEKAKSIYEIGLEISRPSLTEDPSNWNLYKIFVAAKYVPELYEIYFNEKNYKKLNKLNRIFVNSNISNISKRDLKIISNSIEFNSYKIFKTYLRYFEETSDKKKFKMVKNYFLRSVDKTINVLKKSNSVRELFDQGTNKDLVLREIAEIATILIKNSYKTEGTEILNKIQPIIIEYFKEKSSAAVWKPNIEDNVFGLIYLDIAENYLKSDKSFLKKAYKVAQIGKNTFTSRDLNKAISKKKFKDPDGLINKYEKIQRELTVNLRSSQFTPKEVAGNTKISEELNNKNRKLQSEMEQLEKDIKKKTPSYFKLTKIQTAKISELQKLLKKDEVLLDYYFYEKELKVVSISKDKVEILSKKSDFKNLSKLNNEVRNSLIPFDGTIKPFAVNKSFNLNKKTFLFLNKVTKNYENIIVIPDGPLNSMPLHALAYEKSNNCLDCRNIKFNLHNHNFSYFPSADSFSSIKTIAEDYKKTKYLITDGKINNPLKNLKEKVIKLNKKNKLSKSKKAEINDLFYLGIGDPDLYSKIENTKISEEDKIMMLRSLFDAEVINSEIIKEIYGPVAGSADEIKNVAKLLSPLKSKILLREHANELNLKEMDLSSYKIIHFATHGEISGALEGLNEPFLVLSPPFESSMEDGLLTMSEIMSLNTNADLVILSACNTASGDEVGSEGFSGLTKSFFISGSKSVLVSNWYVETYSAKEIVINLFKNIKNDSTLTISKALNLTMLNMLNNKKDRSHPMFWAPFVVVGKNKPIALN